MILWRVAAVAVFLIEVVLSHTPGPASGSQSLSLSRLTGIDERLLRRAAHVFLFTLIGWLAGAGFGWIGVGITAVWSLIDEATKPLIAGRHFSWKDVGLNLAGTAAGMAVWLVVW